MAGYLGSVPVPQATQHRETFTATAGQTTFNTAGYTPLFIDVYLNGVHLSPADITATNGSDVVLAECVVNDIVDIVSYTPFEVASQTFTGTTTMTDVVAATLDISGNIDIDGVTNLDVVDIDGAVDFASTTAHAGNASFADNAKAIFGAGSDLQIYHDGSNSYIQDDGDGQLRIDTNGTDVRITKTNSEYMATFGIDGAVTLYHDNVKTFATNSSGIELGDNDGTSILRAGGANTHLTLGAMGSAGTIKFGAGASNGTIGSTKMTLDASGNLGIGSTSSSYKLFVKGTDSSDSGDVTVRLETGTVSSNSATNDLTLDLTARSKTSGGTAQAHNTEIRSLADASGNGGTLAFYTDNTSAAITERMRIDSIGNVGVGGAPVASATNYNSAVIHARQAGSSSVGSQLRLTTGATGHTASDGSFIAAWSDSGLYITNQESAAIVFSTGGSERMRIDSSGNVGIGTSSPQANHKLTISDTTGNGGGTLGLNVPSSGTSDNLGRLHFGNATDPVLAAIFGIADGANDAGALTFRTEATGAALEERMRINSSGQMFLNHTSSIGTGIVTMDLGGTNKELGIRIRAADAGNFMLGFENSGGTIIGKIVGNASATAYETSSDYRLKENVVYDWDATTRLKQLKPARFNFIADADTTVDGFLAHEAQAVVPECVSGTKDEVDDNGDAVMQGIDQSKLVPLLVKTIQELEARITALEA